MSLTPSAAKYIKRQLGDGTSLDPVQAKKARDLIAECDRALSLARASTARIKAREPRAKVKPPEPSRKEVVADLRAAVLARCGEDCEFCGASLRVAGFELHHVLSGPGRRGEERPETCAGVCLFCHRQMHKSDPGVMRNAMEWSIRRGFREAHTAISRRLAKLETTPGARDAR